ncbi:uncharacterized protein [Oscarella lobularis]|uniref:uncharacterized protein n=1 Tax=Oscarella lobularis TaxID=121494 RepID=UPI003313FBB0
MGESNLKQWTFLLVNGVSLVAGTVGLALLLLMTLGSVYEETKKEASSVQRCAESKEDKMSASEMCYLSDKEDLMNIYVDEDEEDAFVESLSRTLENVEDLFSEAEVAHHMGQQKLKEELLAQRNSLEIELNRLEMEKEILTLAQSENENQSKPSKKVKKPKQRRGAKLQ